MAVKFAVPTAHALRHPETDQYVVPTPGEGYDANDPLVKAYPWAFVTAAQLEELQADVGQKIESVERPVEDAERSPGRKRATKRA